MNIINEKCQVFTPKNIVNELLDNIGYVNLLHGKKILENSCGDGSFLVGVVDRYIRDSILHGFTLDKIVKGLESDIYGIEIDQRHIDNCIRNLNDIANHYNLPKVNWKILNEDVLKFKFDIKFQFVVGNPPYITYSELDKYTRQYIKENFQTCSSGKPDYYYAFIESAIRCLADDGKLAYLVPNNFMKNRFAEDLRNYLLPHLKDIYNYTSIKLFSNKLTSSAIVICDMQYKSNEITYFDIKKNIDFKILKRNLQDKWVFVRENQNIQTDQITFGDYFKASCSIATLLNEVFIIKKYKEEKNYLVVGNFKIEKEILVETVSPRSLNYDRKEYLLFPYEYENNKLIRYTEEEFISRYPYATEYLSFYKGKLLKRVADGNAKWFEFGRSQALAHLRQEKLLLSTLITDKVKVYMLQKDVIPYSGIYIIPKEKYKLQKAYDILNSADFLKYAESIGINSNGKSIRISPRDINNYKFNQNILFK